MDNRQEIKNFQNAALNTKEGSAGWMLKSLATWLDNQMIIGLKSCKLSLGQFAIIMTLLERDCLTQTEIGRKVSMPGYATTRNIDRLEEAGLLTRKKHETSRRSYRIHLTNKGKQLAPKLFAIVEDVNGRFLSSFNEDDKKKFKLMLFDILKHIRSDSL